MADPNPKPGGLFARLLGIDRDDGSPPPPPPAPLSAEPVEAEILEIADVAEPILEVAPFDPETLAEAALVVEVEEAEILGEVAADELPLAVALPVSTPTPGAPIALAVPVSGMPLKGVALAMPIAPPTPVAAPVAPMPPPEPTLPPCSSCGAIRKPRAAFCDDCGYCFPPPGATPAVAAPAPALADVAPLAALAVPAAPPATDGPRLRGRYLLGPVVNERLGVQRLRALDASTEPPTPVVVVRAAIGGAGPAAASDEILPTFDADFSEAASPTSDVAWPRPNWERDLLARANHPGLPAVVDAFTESDTDYCVLTIPDGTVLWDAWDDPVTEPTERYRWLREIAEALAALHKAGAIVEGLTPDAIVVDAERRARIADLADLLPLPLPASPPLRATLATAPELILTPHLADARADLYSFGAMLYALEYLHHGLEEKDFERPYAPRQVTDRFPDVHPLFLRLVNKTFVRDVATRFPTDEAGRTDPTGFQELIQTLAVCERVFDGVRLDVAAWTTTGMVRTGNEDAFAFLHGVDSRQDELREHALILLCDGMGGYEAGEVAAALAIAEMRKFLLDQPMFAGLVGREPGPFDLAEAQKLFDAALRHANREVFTASRTGRGKRGMGCTAEAVYVDHRHVVAGHVGDSRVYHLRDGRLVQLTRDQTLVNRLVELGQISAAEAEHHPRKNELQQAIGGQPDVTPEVRTARLKRGDWVLVCSDGLTNHIEGPELEKMLTREASGSAEEAARRLLNLANLRGASDNATVVVVRAT